MNSYEVTMLENVHANKDEATLTDAKMKICFQTFGKFIGIALKNVFLSNSIQGTYMIYQAWKSNGHESFNVCVY